MVDEYYAADDPRRGNGNYQVSLTSGDKFFKQQNLYLALAYSDGIEDLRGIRMVVHWQLGKWRLGCLAQTSELVNSRAVAYQDRDGHGFFVSATYDLGNWRLKGQAGTDDSGTGLIARRVGSIPSRGLPGL